MKDILTLKLFSRVARLGSFSAASREFNMAQSQASRMIADLEQSLGVKLFTRTTRAVAQTAEGSEFLARVEPIIAALEDAQNSVRAGGELKGILRIAMTTSMGQRIIIPRLPAFTQRYPGLYVNVLLDDKWQDMVKEAVDVGIRVGNLPEGSGTARLITTLQRVVVASPAYLKEAKALEHPTDLAGHRIVGGPAASNVSSWIFERGKEKLPVEVTAHITNNTNSGAVACAAAGMGVTSTTLWACQQEMLNGSLVQVLQDWRFPPIPVHAYFPMGRSTRMAGRAFVDFLVEELGPHKIAGHR